ncbi:CHAT domain-containing protein [Aureisphaera galaxeae]|uniref:CHAT domain-containing protein n=1 Tax=Aureisphaera galaxeae TaxID=1538023 RepID=UPI0023508E6B|nr:CHAT domain-containing protein [Aureisphaera galaxeae]MDC8004745.1 CHAT domain-containing protein [Aureisphaera galaxeae]
MRILFIGINPKDTRQLRLQEEINIIKDVLDAQPIKNKYKLRVRNASTKMAMRRYLNRHKPNVLHISGHGNDDQTLLFEDSSGHSDIVYTNQLGDFLENYNKHLKCVILSACYSLNDIENFSNNIHCVIGMKTAIGNSKAMDFSSSFYDSLSSGQSFESAFNIAKDEINLSQENNEDILKIIIKEDITSVVPTSPVINWRLVGFIVMVIILVGSLMFYFDFSIA